MYSIVLTIIECQKKIYKNELLKILMQISFCISFFYLIFLSNWSFFIYHLIIFNLLTVYLYLNDNH